MEDLEFDTTFETHEDRVRLTFDVNINDVNDFVALAFRPEFETALYERFVQALADRGVDVSEL